MNGTDPTIRMFEENLSAAEKVARRLTSSVANVAGLLPVSAERIENLSDAEQVQVDALLKRFEQLEDLMENKLFRGLALIEGEDLSALSKRDLADLMEKLGAIASASEWMLISLLRNRLAHEYPNQPERQADRLNEVGSRARILVKYLDAIRHYAIRKGHIPS